MPDPTIPSGWPCAWLSTTPPSVADRQSNPSADDLLPQVLALTPRGAAWGTDEVGDGTGASPVQRSFWRGVAAWVATLNAREFEVASQALPSAITISLGDWETELGLPDSCTPASRTLPQRVAAVRARFGAVGGSSPAYFVCVAASLGYNITLEEPTGFQVDRSQCIAGGFKAALFQCSSDGLAGSRIGLDGDPLYRLTRHAPDVAGDGLVGDGIRERRFELSADGIAGSRIGDPLLTLDTADPAADVWGDLVVHVPDPTVATFACSVATPRGALFQCSSDGLAGSRIGLDGDPLYRPPTRAPVAPGPFAGSRIGADGDPLERYTPALDLECELRRLVPPHVRLHWRYELPVAP